MIVKRAVAPSPTCASNSLGGIKNVNIDIKTTSKIGTRILTRNGVIDREAST